MNKNYDLVVLPDLGPMNENGYLLACKSSKRGIVVDPGDEPQRIIDAMDEMSVDFEAIYLTHTHIDHVLAVGPVQSHAECELFLPRADEQMYQHLAMQCEMFGMPIVTPQAHYSVFDGDAKIQVGNLQGQIIHTPGHSPGSCCFYFADDQLLFGGDLLFRESIGRTDLWGGSNEQMRDSLARVMQLPASVEVFPGHGEPTTIGHERVYNPFIAELS